MRGATRSVAPHLTVGRLRDPTKFRAALPAAQALSAVFEALVDGVNVYRAAAERPIESRVQF